MQSKALAFARAAARVRSATLADLVIAASALVASLALLIHGVEHGLGLPRRGSQLDPIGAGFAGAATLPLLGWRRYPLGVFVVTACVTALGSALGSGPWLPLGPTVALYLLAATRDEAKRSSRTTTVAAVALFAVYVGANTAAQRAFPWLIVVPTGLAWSVAWFAGERTRLVRERMAQLRDRALQAEREAERERRVAVAEERARIARDLHDAAGHALNVIAVRAGGARLRHAEEPQRSLAALQAIEEVARQTAADIDRIVHALRKGEVAETGPAAPPGLASLETLVRHHSEAGLDVTVRSSGKPRPLGPSVDQAAYRILQEALTNAARHGTGRVEVGLAFEDDSLRLTTTNPLPRGLRSRPRVGHGLDGMRERAILLGGSLEAHRSNGAYQVSARIPYSGRQD